jgi:tetratricopeptide (TPR) repeat protein
MTVLPWYVSLGPWIWIVVLLAVAGCSIALTRYRLRFRVRRLARRALESFGPSTELTQVAEGEIVVISGKLGLWGKATQRFEDEQPAVVATASPSRPEEVLGALAVSRVGEGVFVEIAGEEVGLEGSIEVRVGSREVHLGRRFQRVGRRLSRVLRDLDDEAFSAIQRHSVAFRSLARGDQVRVQGFLRRLPAPALADSYRVAADRWMISSTPAPDLPQSREHVVAVAFEGAPEIEGPARRVQGVNLIVSCLLTMFAIWLAGGVLYTVGVEPGAAYGHCEETAVRPSLKTATLFPGARRMALDAWASQLVRSCEPTDAAISEHIALRLVSGRCGSAARELARRYELDQAIEAAHECRDPDECFLAVGALYHRGRFPEASDLLSELPLEVQAARYPQYVVVSHLLAGRRDLAQRVLAKRMEQFPEDSDYFDDENIWDQRCLYETLAAGEGDSSAIQRLRGLASQAPSHSSCRLLLADLLKGDERLQFLRSFEDLPYAFRRFADLLALETALGSGLEDASWDLEPSVLSVTPRQLLSPHETDVVRFTGLDRPILEHLEALERPGGDVHRTRAVLRTQASIFAFTIGENQEARRQAEAALLDVNAIGGQEHLVYGHGTWASLARGRLAVIALDMGDMDRGRELTEELREMPSSYEAYNPVAALWNYLEQGDTEHLSESFEQWYVAEGFWEEAHRGDGRALSNLLRRPGALDLRYYHPIWANLVTTGQRQVLRRYMWSSTFIDSEGSLTTSLIRVSTDWQVATEMGDRQAANRIDEARRGLRDALLRRDTRFARIAM